VALGLLSVLFLIAGRLLVAARRMQTSAARVAAGPRLGVLGVQLRRDAESAVGVPSSGGTWSSLALRLHLENGSTVEYEFDGENLHRRMILAGGASGGRIVARGLRSFRWRSVAGRALDVKLSFRQSELGERPSPEGSGSGPTLWWVRCVPRGAGWWRRW